ncbi:CgeB family protein [Rhodococcoides corynebacterioides]|uniref:CgeB family protein n=1 Tax=Rhodococcoides corynebacterioides TaxID=53972 RepID=UPI001C9A9D02|nr:glycosyltransferase [Rhodococcus corynebacterioides]MBY6349075.1 glycosyltransferase [Rhodococcus corynebacterioides]
MKILFLGDDWVGSNARSMADGFREAGHDVLVIDTTPVALPGRLTPPWVYAKLGRGRAPWVLADLHRRIDAAARDFRPDMLFCFRTVHLDQDRLLALPAAVRVHYSPDDVANPYNTTPEYLRRERDWDLVVTTKEHNVPELAERGARETLFVLSAYDPAWHRPTARRSPQEFTVGFVGACRPDRRDFVTDLARTHGARMAVLGPGWRRVPALRATSAHLGGAVYGEEFSNAVASIGANLVLLNSDNRDTHTCRTFEVPAAGGLFVGERTHEHARLLDDGTECRLFSTPEELAEILAWAETEPDKARDMAERGRSRIVADGHAYVDRAREITAAIR